MATLDSASETHSPQRLGILYNRRSGRHRRRWGRHPLPPDVPAIQAETPVEIGAAVAELAAAGVDVLAIAGGDGTVQCALTGILLGGHFHRPPVVALIPTGSTNMTARDVGFVDVRRHGWQPLVDWAASQGDSGVVSERAVLRIQASDSQPPLCGMFFGLGGIHHAVHFTQNRLHRVGLRGEIGPGLTFLRFLKSLLLRDRQQFTPTQLQLTDDSGHVFDDSALFLAVSTLNRLVLNLHPFWGTEDSPIAWTAVCHAAPRFLLHLPAVARGRPARRERSGETGYISHNSHELTLVFDDGFIVDGEFHRSCPDDGPVRISVAGHIPFLKV